MRTFRVMLIEQVDGQWEGRENIREIIEFEADGQGILLPEGHNVFEILESLRADIAADSEDAS